MTTSWCAMALSLVLFCLPAADALQCYYGSNATKFTTCEASEPEVCVYWSQPCYPGSQDTLCQDLHPNETFAIFHSDCLPCKDNYVYIYQPKCCTTDFCNGPMADNNEDNPPVASTPVSKPKTPSTPDLENDPTVIILIIFAILLFIASAIASAKKLNDLRKKSSDGEIESETKGLLNEVSIDQDNDGTMGSFSVVRKVEKDGKKYAEKKILTTIADLYEEYKVMVLLDHRNIVKAHEFNASSTGMPGLLMDYCDYSLADKMKYETISDLEVLSFIIQLASAVLYMHFKLRDKVVIHCDICPRNILLIRKHEEPKYMHTMLLKLADFGMAKVLAASEDRVPTFVAERDSAHQKKAKDIWTASEVVEKHVYSIFTDLHSFAIVCAQILLKKIITEETKLNQRLKRAVIKSKAPYVMEIASFCAEILEKKKKELSSANEEKVKLENLKKVLKTHYKLMVSQIPPKPDVAASPSSSGIIDKNGNK